MDVYSDRLDDAGFRVWQDAVEGEKFLEGLSRVSVITPTSILFRARKFSNSNFFGPTDRAFQLDKYRVRGSLDPIFAQHVANDIHLVVMIFALP